MVKKKSSKKLQEKEPKEIALPVIQAVSGILQSKKSEVVRSLGDSIQEFVKGNQWYRLKKEIEGFRKKGESNEEYFDNPEKQVRLLDSLKLFDKDIPDDDVFRAMKSIFFTTISKDISEEDDLSGYELLKVCKKLTGGDILILKACFDITELTELTPQPDLQGENVNNWFEAVANKIGHGIPDLVKIREENLMNLCLIADRVHPHNYNKPAEHFEISAKTSNYFRLTPLGYKLCEFIAKYPEN